MSVDMMLDLESGLYNSDDRMVFNAFYTKQTAINGDLQVHQAEVQTVQEEVHAKVLADGLNSMGSLGQNTIGKAYKPRKFCTVPTQSQISYLKVRKDIGESDLCEATVSCCGSLTKHKKTKNNSKSVWELARPPIIQVPVRDPHTVNSLGMSH
jgi:hypothetical protein